MKYQEDELDKVLKAFRRVIEDWDVIELILFILLFPASLLYVIMRTFQEYE